MSTGGLSAKQMFQITAILSEIRKNRGKLEQRYTELEQKSRAESTIMPQRDEDETTRQTSSKKEGKGKFLRVGGENFDIILNILIGIRRCLGNLVHMPGQTLTTWQYKKRLSCESDWIQNTQGGEGNNQRINSFTFYDYAPMVFLKIRERFNITEDEFTESLSPQQILNSFLTHNYDTLYELCSSGQSGSLFYYTKDKKYMIKTLPKREFDKFFSILEPYFKHIRKHPDSLISRFFGLYKVKWQDSKGKDICRYLVIMNNIFKEFNVGIRFDLKGSFTGRNLIKED